MKRSGIRVDPEKVREWVERSRTPLARKVPIGRAGSSRSGIARVSRADVTPRAEFRDPSVLCRACWRRPGIHSHHVVYKVRVILEGGDPYSPLDALSVCGPCHAGHHLASVRISLRSLRDENYAFAFALLGAAAFDYLRRRYSGDDPRLEAALTATNRRAR